MELSIILLASWGLCHSVMYGNLFDPLRNLACRVRLLRSLLSCATCTGFWCGAALVWPRAPSVDAVFDVDAPFLTGALACAAVCTLLDAVYVRLVDVDPLEPIEPGAEFVCVRDGSRALVVEGNRLYVTVDTVERRRTMTRLRFDADYHPA